jgi:tetratricopeptide (TPR) repeat protein
MNAVTDASEFFVAGGTLRPDSPSYIKRPADDDLLGLALAGKFCYVLTARQMGKSSLMVRTDRRLKEQGVSTAIIDLTHIGTVAVDQWYLGLLTKIRDDLRLSVNPEVWWTERASLGAVQRFTSFLREVVLKEMDGRVVIFIDEIDTTLRLDFADDFFAAIRAIYNARANDQEFNRLTFVLLGVATPSDLIQDKARTPFNIGQAIDLREFRWENTQAFQHGMTTVYPDQGEVIFARIFYWTNGHPYLTQKLCWAVTEARGKDWNDERVDELVGKLFLSDEARKEPNLQFVRNSVAASPQRRALLGLYRKVYEGKTVSDDESSLDQNRLKLFGLVRAEKGELKVRNEIYRRAFNLDWIKANTPVDWTRRIAIVSTVLVLLLASFVVYSLSRQKQQTAEAQAQALVQQFQSTTSADVRITSLAGLFGLGGYEDRAKALFNGLAPADQLALFNLTNPSSVGNQLIKVVKGIYTDLGNDERGNQLLQAMIPPLRKVGDSESINLATEIDQWSQGRTYYAQGEYQQAVRAYDVAISLNGRNPGTYFDRGLAYASLGEPDKALADLEAVLNLNSGKAWQDRVRQTVVSDGRLYSAWWGGKEKYKSLAALLPTPTGTPTPTNTPTPTITPPATITRLPANTPTPITPSSTPLIIISQALQSVSVFAAPDASSYEVAIISSGQTVQVLARCGTWLYVRVFRTEWTGFATALAFEKLDAGSLPIVCSIGPSPTRLSTAASTSVAPSALIIFGPLTYGPDNSTLANGATLNIGSEIHFTIKNVSGSDLHCKRFDLAVRQKPGDETFIHGFVTISSKSFPIVTWGRPK